ncbi:MAG TPA: hypothetical protein RMH99_01160 [Sandaracinaceae bacterium LLY-WYZ-13_1]|nr:hypothetical protein [Sandaracinaceae bacterium LLY-WYZ-13_1]
MNRRWCRCPFSVELEAAKSIRESGISGRRFATASTQLTTAKSQQPKATTPVTPARTHVPRRTAARRAR